MIHLPILRAGEPYTSLSVQEVSHIQTGEPLVQVSQANRGLVAKDLNAAAANKHALDRLSVSELAGMTREAARSICRSRFATLAIISRRPMTMSNRCLAQRVCPKPSAARIWRKFSSCVRK